MTLLILLQDAAAAQPSTGSGWGTILMMVLIFVVFYIFMIYPQTKKQKELQKQRDALTRGNKVVTSGGIHGTIKDINDDTLVIEIAKDVKITIDKSSVFPLEQSTKKEDKDETVRGERE